MAVINEVFQAPMSLGGLSNCEARIAEALEKPYHDTLEHVRRLDVAHADETGWPRGNRKLGWLWAFGCTTAAVAQAADILQSDCEHHHALELGIWSDKSRIHDPTWQKLKLLLDKYIDL
jgi:hypothetical protein